jgi:lichenan operon transcriptional antiterminator
MDALQTKIGVAVSKEGISWGNNIVNIVLLIAINKLDKKIFLTINDSILSLFENQNIFKIMKNAESLADFKDIVFFHI